MLQCSSVKEHKMGTKCTRLLHELKAHYEFMTVCLTMSDKVARVETTSLHTATNSHTHTGSVIFTLIYRTY